MLSGTRLSTSQRWIVSWNLPNTGNAENTARPTVNSGTRASTVVKVSELALTPRRASRKRRYSTPVIWRQGNSASSCHQARSWTLQSGEVMGRYHAIAMNPNPDPPPAGVRFSRTLAVTSTVGLILLCLAWELWLAPLRPGGSWLALKALPLLLPLRGVWKQDVYTMQWSSMFIFFYFTEGVVRATSTSGVDAGTGALLAGGEVLLTV